MKQEKVPTRATDTTRDDLIAAGISMFGELGFEAASVRALSRKAGANIAAVKYHFGSKTELFEVCVKVAARGLSAHGPERFLQHSPDEAAMLSPAAAEQTLRDIIRSVLVSAFDPKQADLVRLLHSQVTSEGAGLPVFVDAVLLRHLDVFATLVAKAEERDVKDQKTRMRALAIMLQTVGMVRSRMLLSLTLDLQDPENKISDLVDAIYPARQHDLHKTPKDTL